MNWAFAFFMPVFGLGLFFSVLALLVERLLILNGIARGNSAVWLVLASFYAAFVKQLTNPDPLYWLVGAVVVIAGPIIANRNDVYDTFKKGRWWWKHESKVKEN